MTWDTCQQQGARGNLGHLSTARSQGRLGTPVNSKEPGATWDTCQSFIQSVLLAVISETKFLKTQQQKQNIFSFVKSMVHFATKSWTSRLSVLFWAPSSCQSKAVLRRLVAWELGSLWSEVLLSLATLTRPLPSTVLGWDRVQMVFHVMWFRIRTCNTTNKNTQKPY